MLAPSLFRDRKEFLLVAIVLITIIITRLFFIYQNYKSLKSLNNYYHTEAQILKEYKDKKDGSTLLKLKGVNGLDFYLRINSKPPKPFEWVRVKIKLKKESNFFDYLKGFLAQGAIVKDIEKGFDVKAFARKAIDKQHTNSKIATFYNAIFLADPLDNKIRERVSNLGISHLVAISGFHLGILWIVIFGTLYLPYKFLQQKFFPWRNRNIDLGFIALIILLIYVLFINAPPAVVRSYVMLFITWVVLILGMEFMSFQFLIFVLLVILAVMPKLITSVALLLSFMGVYYIFLILKWLKGHSAWFITLVAIPIGVFLLMFPIGHFFFNNTTIWQLMSPILSLLFIIFYPIVAILHLFGVGGIFDNSLMNLFNLPTKSIKVIMPLWIILPYIALSIVAISKKRAFYTTLIFATLITLWYMGLYLFN